MTFLSKQEREKLRQEINSRKGYISSNELIDRGVLLGFLDHIDALEGQIMRLNQFQKWADEGNCPALVNDDDGHWAVSFDGVQTVPTDDEPSDVATSFFIEAASWKNSVEEAIDAAIEMIAAETAIASAPKCQTCNGHGLIGGFVNAENGYHSEPCPDCNSASAPEVK